MSVQLTSYRKRNYGDRVLHQIENGLRGSNLPFRNSDALLSACALLKLHVEGSCPQTLRREFYLLLTAPEDRGDLSPAADSGGMWTQLS